MASRAGFPDCLTGQEVLHFLVGKIILIGQIGSGLSWAATSNRILDGSRNRVRYLCATLQSLDR